MNLFKKKEVIEEPPQPEKTDVVKVSGQAAKSGLKAKEEPSLAEQLMAEFQKNYGSVAEDDSTKLLFAIYAETRLNRDILAQILAIDK
jgi:hypothetical protein